ncbi:MAG: 2-oxoacid:acceptor oxidoreductase family protein [Candidatus Brocadiae bacterium]|nr:2-oxoacid:acceptor oxidoreductase family protein [Candidatus Brocadiia bacterium]
MQSEVIMAGFGGQGIMLIGKILAYAGMEEGKEVSWLPSYGPEMRGGTANCTVVLSDHPIGSPVVDSPFGLVVMNRPSLDRFAPNLKSKGILIINKSLIDVLSPREDVDTVYVPCNDIAIECGTGKAANMVALGAYIGRSKAVKLETVYTQIQSQFSGNTKLISLNMAALKRGYDLANKEQTSV